MSLSSTVKKWGKEARKPMHFIDTPMERMKGRMIRKDRKVEEKKRKYAAKMKGEGYPNRFISEKEQETHD